MHQFNKVFTWKETDKKELLVSTLPPPAGAAVCKFESLQNKSRRLAVVLDSQFRPGAGVQCGLQTPPSVEANTLLLLVMHGANPWTGNTHRQHEWPLIIQQAASGKQRSQMSCYHLDWCHGAGPFNRDWFIFLWGFIGRMDISDRLDNKSWGTHSRTWSVWVSMFSCHPKTQTRRMFVGLLDHRKQLLDAFLKDTNTQSQLNTQNFQINAVSVKDFTEKHQLIINVKTSSLTLIWDARTSVLWTPKGCTHFCQSHSLSSLICKMRN